MKRLVLLLLFCSIGVLAAPPIVGPRGLTPGEAIAQRQGALFVDARQGISQNTLGSRLDEFSLLNPGSLQSRFLFNSTVLAANQSSPQIGYLSGNNLNAAYKKFLATQHEFLIAEQSKPFASTVAKSQVQGMVFIKATPSGNQVVGPATDLIYRSTISLPNSKSVANDPN